MGAEGITTTRRDFLGGLAAASCAGCLPRRDGSPRRLTIAATDLACEREPLVRPFGFKGGYLTELWQAVAKLTGASGTSGVGLGTQSVLWSDAAIFSSRSEAAGNELMFALTRQALELSRGRSFETPVDLLDALYPEVLAYGRTLSGRPDLRPTFALNALVAVDNAAWVLYARENGFATFDAAVPAEWRAGIPAHHERCAMIPLITYGTPLDEVRRLAAEGSFFFKIKIASRARRRRCSRRTVRASRSCTMSCATCARPTPRRARPATTSTRTDATRARRRCCASPTTSRRSARQSRRQSSRSPSTS